MTLSHGMIRIFVLVVMALVVSMAPGCTSDTSQDQGGSGQSSQALDRAAEAVEDAAGEASEAAQDVVKEAGEAAESAAEEISSKIEQAAPQVDLPDPATRREAPNFTLKNLEGKDVQLADFRGKVVILNFWATWCPPCKREIPDFIKLQREYESKGLEIVGVSLDKEGASIVEPFAKQNGINYTMLVDGNPAASLYGGIRGIPTTFVLDREGRIVQQLVGYNPMSVWESLTTALLAES